MKYPNQISITEVGPRDGFQNLKQFIPTPVKQQVIDSIVSAGVKSMEMTSFVHPKAIPQMADAKDIAVETLEKHPGIKAIALIPNLKGAQNACAAGVKEMTYVISASEKHNMENVNRTKEESFSDLKKIVQEIPDINIKLSIATVFGCPYEGQISEKAVFEMVDEAIAFGISEFALCDTIGVADPVQTSRVSKQAMQLYDSQNVSIALHMHNTRGMGLANALAAMNSGITTFETSIGGLGGCPFAPGAAGNTATEDLVNMLNSMGIDTGIDLDKYLDAVAFVKERIKQSLSSNMATANKYNCYYIDKNSI